MTVRTDLSPAPTDAEAAAPRLKPGDRVCCCYRIPTALQWWLGAADVGTLEEPGDDAAEWNGRNSERVYCEVAGMARVRYPWGVMHDAADSLFPAPRPESFRLTSEAEGRRLWELAGQAERNRRAA